MSTEVKYDPSEGEDLYEVNEMTISFQKRTEKVVGSGYESPETEVVDTELVTFSCPMTRFYNEETGEELSEDAALELSDRGLIRNAERLDVGEVRFETPSETYIAEYDTSNLPI